MKHRVSFVIFYLCLLSLFTLGAAELLTADKTERPSMTENRMLAGFPELTAKSLLSGDFTEGFEVWLSDAFFARDRLADFSKEVLGVFSVKDEDSSPLELEGAALFEEREGDAQEQAWVEEQLAQGEPAPTQAPQEAAPDASARDASLWLINAKGQKEQWDSYPADALAHLAQTLKAYRACLPADGSVHFVNVPTADIAYKIAFGSYTGWESDLADVLQPMVGEGVYIYNAAEVLPVGQEERLYPITDHHWHSLGAWRMASAMLSRQGVPVGDYYDYRYTLSNQGSGRSFARGALENMELSVNTFLVPEPVSPVQSWILTYLTQRERSVYMDLTQEGYRQFLGGSYTPWRLFETGFHTGRAALVIGDSFTNSFVPFLVPYYDRVLSTDLRDTKYTPVSAGANVSQYMEEYGVKEVYIITCTMTPVEGSMLQESLDRFLYLPYGG